MSISDTRPTKFSAKRPWLTITLTISPSHNWIGSHQFGVNVNVYEGIAAALRTRSPSAAALRAAWFRMLVLLSIPSQRPLMLKLASYKRFVTISTFDTSGVVAPLGVPPV